MSFLSRSHHSTVTNYSEFVENLRTGKQKPSGNVPPLQAMEEFFKELGNFLKDNNFRNLDEVLEAAKNVKEASRSTTMDYRKYHGSKPETWKARHLENFASNMGPNSVLGAGLLQHLADALMHSGYNNLGELIEGAERADSLQEQISHRNVRIENLEAEIRIQDAKYTRLNRSYMDAVQNLRLVTESRDGKDTYISQLKEKLEHNREVRDGLSKDNERLRRELREKEQRDHSAEEKEDPMGKARISFSSFKDFQVTHAILSLADYQLKGAFREDYLEAVMPYSVYKRIMAQTTSSGWWEHPPTA